MKVYTQEEVSKLLNRLAAHFSMTGEKQFDKGYNEAIKKACDCVREFEVKGKDIKQHLGWYTTNELEQLQKSY